MFLLLLALVHVAATTTIVKLSPSMHCERLDLPDMSGVNVGTLEIFKATLEAVNALEFETQVERSSIPALVHFRNNCFQSEALEWSTILHKLNDPCSSHNLPAKESVFGAIKEILQRIASVDIHAKQVKWATMPGLHQINVCVVLKRIQLHDNDDTVVSIIDPTQKYFIRQTKSNK